jgi:hypothetical protein
MVLPPPLTPVAPPVAGEEPPPTSSSSLEQAQHAPTQALLQQAHQSARGSPAMAEVPLQKSVVGRGVIVASDRVIACRAPLKRCERERK